MSYTKNELSLMTLTKLKEICKENSISGCYRFKSADKGELVELIFKSLKGSPPKAQSPKAQSPKAQSPPKECCPPIVISKTELTKLTVKQLKKLLEDCNQSISGLKADLVSRLFEFCKDKLNKPSVPISPKTKTLTVKQLKDLLIGKNIKHYNAKLKKADLEFLSTTKTCNVETNDFCGPNEVCDVRDGICTKMEYVSAGVVQATIRGHKIVGSKELIEKIIGKVEAQAKPKPPVKSPVNTGPTKEELVQSLEKRGINHSLGMFLTKEQLEYLLKANKCDPKKRQGCSGDEVCDLRDGICTKPEYMTKGVVQAEIRGIKITGTKEIIDSLIKKLNRRVTISISPPVPINLEKDEDTIFTPGPESVFPELPKVDIPPMPVFGKPASPPKSSTPPKMPKISAQMFKTMKTSNVSSNIDERIKASLGLTTL
jgi:hypothetical protein